MLYIKNINTLIHYRIGDWGVHGITTTSDNYIVNVVHNGIDFNMRNLCVERNKTKFGDYRIVCYETKMEHHMPIELIKDREEFIRFLINELI